VFLVWLILSLPGLSLGSTPAKKDTTGSFSQPVEVEGLVVRANRIPLTELRIPAAATVVELGARDLTESTGELVAQLPGLRAYPSGNRWGQATVDVRGFAGGGQAQYLKVTYDGIPVNRVASGLVNWAALSPDELQRVEAINGPVSAQYGDFGFGGLLALTSSWLPLDRQARVTSSYGSFGSFAVDGQTTRRFQRGRAHLSLSEKQSDGWRRHSRLEAQKVGVKLQHSLGSSGRLSTLFSYSHTDEDVPGAVTREQLDTDRADAARDFMGALLPDKSDYKDVLAGLEADFTLEKGYELKTQGYLTSSVGERIVTVLTPVNSEPELFTTGGDLSLGMKRQLVGRPFHLVAGTSFEYGRLNSYWTEYGGTSSTDQVISAGTGRRTEVALYAHGMFDPTERIQITLGLRVDHIAARFESDSSAVASSGDKATIDHTAWSPKVGVGYEITPTITAYATVSGAFKSPTLLHLYDSPPFPLPPEYGGGWTLISNRDLKPQEGVCYEVGVKLIDDRTRFTASYYLYNITNEIDFSLSKLSYDNIGESRHQGIEVNLSRRLLSALSVYASLEAVAAKFKGGDNDGNQINGVPEHRYGFGVTLRPAAGASVALRSSGQDGLFLDEANEIELADFATVSLSGTFEYRYFVLGLSVENLFDREYSYDGYIGLTGESRFYPGAPRSVMATVSATL